MGRALKAEEISRVVVRGANWVGDAVMTLPALRELRRMLPAAHITLATRGWAEKVFEGADFVNDILVSDDAGGGLRSILGDAREWRARRFDLAVLFPNAFAPALVAALARVPARAGYAAQGRGPLLTHPLAVPEWRGSRHEVFYYLNIVSELGRSLGWPSDAGAGAPELVLHVNEGRRSAARQLLRAGGVRPGRPLVALCPGSTNSRAKRWPAERFAALGDMLRAESGAEIVLVGAPDELEISEQVARLMRTPPAVLTGKTGLGEVAAVLSVADLLVTNDTGPAHVAAAVGCPVVVIFGPTNPSTTRPFSALAEVVRVPPDCAPCMLRDCPIDHRCMTAVTPEAVFERAAGALPRRRGLEVAL